MTICLPVLIMSPVVRKPDFCLRENKGTEQLRSSCELISSFVFATRIVQFFYFLNPEFPVSSHRLCLYSSGCVRLGRKPRRPGFSRRDSVILAHVRNCGIMYANMVSHHTSRSEQRLFKKGFLITCPNECHDFMFYECENHTF